MSELISNLNTIESCKLDIKSAIEAKGVDMTSASLPDYASCIASISGGGGGGYTEKDITERNFNIVNLNNSASYVDKYVFCTYSIQTINLSECKYVDECAFQSCTLLSQISLPVCSYIGNGAFQSCTSLSQISLPVCSYIGNAAFFHCDIITDISLPVCSYIGMQAFRYCSHLSEITIGKDISYVITLGANVFLATPIASGTGTIYVPASLVSDYQAANNWSAFASQIVSIPE